MERKNESSGQWSWKLPALLLLGLLAGYSGQAQQGPTFEWAVTCGVSSGQTSASASPARLVVDALGNTYVTGSFGGTITLGSASLTAVGQGDVFVAKLDPQGNYLWVAVAAGPGGEGGNCLGVDNAGGVYVGGSFSSYSLTFGGGSTTLYNSSAKTEAFVARLDAATGQWLWAKRAGGTGPDAITALAVSPTGEVSVAGEFASATADFGSIVLAGSPRNSSSFRQDVFVARLSSGGQWLWAVRGGGGSYGGKTAANLVTDAAGFLYLAGTITGGVSLNATMPYTASFGNTALIGSYTGNNVDYSQDGYVARLDAAGNWLWAVQGNAAGTNLAAIKDLATDGQGHLYVAEEFAGNQAVVGSTTLPNQGSQLPPGSQDPTNAPVYYTPNAFVARLDAATGQWQWAVRAGGSDGAQITQVVADMLGRVYIAGYLDKILPVSTTLVKAAQLDGATGNWRWAGWGGYIVGIPVLAVDSFNRLYMASYFVGPSATFGPFTLSGPGADYYTGVVARLGAGVLAAQSGAGAMGGLQVWPNPAAGRQVQVSGAEPGAGVQVFDALGRLVRQATMPATGPLTLPMPTYLPAGVYVVRSGQQVRQLALE